MGWGQSHTGTTGEVAEAHRLLDEAAVRPGNLAERVRGLVSRPVFQRKSGQVVLTLVFESLTEDEVIRKISGSTAVYQAVRVTVNDRVIKDRNTAYEPEDRT